MKTDAITGGFGGGFTDAKTVRHERGTVPLVQVRREKNALMVPNKDARPKRQLRTGASNCDRQLTEDSIARLPRWKRWGLYAFAALCMTGIAPMALASFLIWLCDVVGWWLLIPLYIVVGRAFWRVMWS